MWGKCQRNMFIDFHFLKIIYLKKKKDWSWSLNSMPCLVIFLPGIWDGNRGRGWHFDEQWYLLSNVINQIDHLHTCPNGVAFSGRQNSKPKEVVRLALLKAKWCRQPRHNVVGKKGGVKGSDVGGGVEKWLPLSPQLSLVWHSVSYGLPASENGGLEKNSQLQLKCVWRNTAGNGTM